MIHPALFVRKSVHDRLGLYLHKRFLNAADFAFELSITGGLTFTIVVGSLSLLFSVTCARLPI